MGKSCIKCGFELHSGSRFCGKCGAPVVSVTRPSKQADSSSVQPGTNPLPIPPPASTLASTQQSVSVSPPRPATQPVNPTPVTAKPARLVKGKMKKGAGALSMVLGALLVVQTAVVALWGWPGFLVNERLGKTTIVDGLAYLPGLTVDFSGSAYDSEVLENKKTASVDLAEGAVSAGYDLAFTNIPQGPVMLSAPMPEGLALAEGETLYLDIGFTMLDGTGEQIMVYDHVKASTQEGWMTAEITPSVYEGMEYNVYLQSGPYLRSGYSEKMRFNAQFKLKLVQASQSERFNLIIDKSRQMATSLPTNAREEILSRMEQVFQRMKDFGFNVEKRTKWPMDVFVTTLPSNAKNQTKTYGQYVSSLWGINHGYINLSRFLFMSYDIDETTSVFAHEFTHFIQECYVSSQYQRLHWLDEATATFFEKYFGGVTDHGSKQYQLYEGILPESDSPEEGYVRAALVSYWAHKGGWLEGKDPLTGIDKMSGLIKLYSPGGYVMEKRWLESMNDLFGDPSEYAVDFFTRMVLTHDSVWAEVAYQPYILHSHIINKADEDIEKFTSELKLLWDLMISEEGQVSSVKVPGYGARVVAISMDKDGLSMLKEDGELSITAPGGETLVLVRSWSARTEAIKGATVSAPKLRQTLEDKYRYLLLVVNTTAEEKTISYTVTGEAKFQEQQDESTVEKVPFSGTYRGIVTNLQMDEPDSPVTTVVTFVENSGPGGQYRIECTVDETEKKLIDGKYNVFISWTSGEVNEDKDFVFSLDGKSFVATLKNLSGAPWVTISGER